MNILIPDLPTEQPLVITPREHDAGTYSLLWFTEGKPNAPVTIPVTAPAIRKGSFLTLSAILPANDRVGYYFVVYCTGLTVQEIYRGKAFAAIVTEPLTHSMYA